MGAASGLHFADVATGGGVTRGGSAAAPQRGAVRPTGRSLPIASGTALSNGGDGRSGGSCR